MKFLATLDAGLSIWENQRSPLHAHCSDSLRCRPGSLLDRVLSSALSPHPALDLLKHDGYFLGISFSIALATVSSLRHFLPAIYYCFS
jgi:hypothetical protein